MTLKAAQLCQTYKPDKYDICNYLWIFVKSEEVKKEMTSKEINKIEIES